MARQISEVLFVWSQWILQIGIYWDEMEGVHIHWHMSPFGLHSAPNLFNVLAHLLIGVLMRQGMTSVFHYVGDFWTLDPPVSNICQQNLSIIQKVCASLGAPLALEKVGGSSTTLTFLGITLDTTNMQAIDLLRRSWPELDNLLHVG